MPYATVAQLKAVIPASDLDLLTDFEDAGGPSDARLEQALDDASALIDTYIAKAVTSTPLIDPPHILTVICRDLAMHRLYQNLGNGPTGFEPERDNALDLLRSIARGETAIGDDDGPAEITSPGVAMTDGPDRQMTRSKLWGF